MKILIERFRLPGENEKPADDEINAGSFVRFEIGDRRFRVYIKDDSLFVHEVSGKRLTVQLETTNTISIK